MSTSSSEIQETFNKTSQVNSKVSFFYVYHLKGYKVTSLDHIIYTYIKFLIL